ncbi:MAG TPA: hypothetical protein VNR70_01395 [Steroidobacteraceae bacterium]|nr:hypothetical protein [Steroidobacteraceae bacterium]
MRYSRPNTGILYEELVHLADRLLSEIVLRYIIALPILLLSLLAAGQPAFACEDVEPARDCCPNGPNAPCAPKQATTAESIRPDVCCAATGTIATTTAMAVPNERGKHWDHAAPPVLLVVLTTLTTAYVQSPSVDDFHIVSQPLSDSTLYLSTGRLRL